MWNCAKYYNIIIIIVLSQYIVFSLTRVSIRVPYDDDSESDDYGADDRINVNHNPHSSSNNRNVMLTIRKTGTTTSSTTVFGSLLRL